MASEVPPTSTQSPTESWEGHRVVFSSPGQVSLEQHSVQAPGPGEVLLKTRKTLISAGTELTMLRGDARPGSRWAALQKFPWTPGYCHVGDVVRFGDGVTGLRVGERVVSWGGHAAWCVLPASRVYPCPSKLKDEEAVFWMMGVIALNAIRAAQLQLGTSVAVLGTGVLGQLTIQLASLSGAHPILAIGRNPRRLDLAAKSGAAHLLCGGPDQIAADVRKILGGNGVDVAFEVTGAPDIFDTLTKVPRRMGKIVLVGASSGPTQIDFHDDVLFNGLSIVGVHNSTHPAAETPQTPWTLARNAALFLEYLGAGRITIEALISHTFPASEAPQAYALLAGAQFSMGVVLDWTT